MKPRKPRKPALPVDWSCRTHKVKAPAECRLCADQLPLFEAEEPTGGTPPARATVPAQPVVSESFRRRVDAAAERRKVKRGVS
jgi:hypothetical protein